MEFNSCLAKKILGAFGPSGHEHQVTELLIEEIKDFVDEYYIDPLGNLIAHKKGEGKKLMFSAHIDQIGFMVIAIDDKGFIRIAPIGGHSPARLLDQRVIFANGVEGVISSEKCEDLNKLTMAKLYVDIATLTKEETDKVVSVGDVCIIKASYYENDQCIMAGALDDRIAAYILVEALKAQKNTCNDVYYVFSTQEEVGLRGAFTAAYNVHPEIGYAVDVTATGDVIDAKPMAVKLGGGAAIKLMDSSVITHPYVKKLTIDRAKEHNIKHQFEVLTAGGTDAGAIHRTKGGIPSGCISIPTRWLHGKNETAAKSDIMDCVKLVLAIVDNPIE